MILRAKLVVPISQPPIEDGAVVVENEAIVAVGPAKDLRALHPGEVKDLGEVVVSPDSSTRIVISITRTWWARSNGGAVSSNGFCSWWR